jgi:hypothetical protein
VNVSRCVTFTTLARKSGGHPGPPSMLAVP